MSMLSWDESLFRNIEVFDPDYIPDEVLFRDGQIRQLVSCIKPVFHSSSPINAFCIGPPSTGKTSTIRYVLREAEEEIEGFKYSYIRSPRFKEPYKIFAKIFQDVIGHQAPATGISKTAMMDRVWRNLEDPLVVVLDDVNFLSKNYADEVLYEILKAPEEYGVKVGVIAAATDIRFPMLLDPFVGAIFHYVEIHYPTYTYSEVREILKKRVEYGFIPDVFEEEAFERVVEIAHNAGDVRYGIYLLKAAGMNAESRGSRKVQVEDVEKANAGESLSFIAKIVSALNSEERAVLRIIYSQEEISTGDLYDLIHSEVRMGYRKYYNVLEKLERLRLIDIAFGDKGRGKTRYIYRKFDPEVVEKALEF
ncbi:ORC1-type DNA replication protein [Archaeoglobus neptunius]|uniref:ORC1-type DNA replication protein n=1 Tax=Archaeoglobus neptunius TaxID=2798580 RepID=UPI0019263EB9|nr:ORC1-type DNA replication protein [Archaeoglobus neptunius]